MPKITIYQDEFYDFRVHDASEYRTLQIEVSQETLNRWDLVLDAYHGMQDEMNELYHQDEEQRQLPKHWWTIVVISDTQTLKFGFYGNDIEVRTQLDIHKKDGVQVSKRYAAKQEASLYQQDKDKNG